MEIILLSIYSFFVWLVFFKFKWLPWNFISQVITITLPIIGLTILILSIFMVSNGRSWIRRLIELRPPEEVVTAPVP